MFARSLCLIMLTIACMTAGAQTFEVDGINYRVLSEDKGTVEVTRNEYSGDVIIPQSVTYNSRDYAVTEIDDTAFVACRNLSSVSMPSIETIGYGAFSGCMNLASVSMPSVVRVDDKAFDNCQSLLSVSMPSATTIGNDAFFACTKLSSIDMPLVTTIGDHTFLFCPSLTSISMPSVTTIGDNAFFGCYDLSSLDLPVSVKSVGGYVFKYCPSLRAIHCHWKEPLQCKAMFDKKVLRRATLHVPAGTKEAYGKTQPWCDFRNIEEEQ